MSRSAEEIFHEVKDLPPAERSGFLRGACGTDADLRSRIETLLRDLASPAAHPRPAPSAQNSTIAVAPREEIGQQIGRYKLLEQIGEGGFGTVWAAEQREPVKRRVALKIIKLGMDTKQVIARFEAERQALAMMDHPNIARVLDAGSTDLGRPFFVMELVKGVPILDYCDTEKLDTRARLELFMRVCHAIQHAHQKGIIHRDIKPSNVLVTLHDGVPVPKVIDFGIAKATNQDLTEKTLYTQHRQMIGTPAYMSPEQAEMSGLDVDTRSDIYSLGVLLYELLTGTTPFATEELMSKGFAEMMRIIRDVEPHKPSTRMGTLGVTGTRTALQRHAADPKKLGLLLKGDLDWIVMKCLEKDRARRYETASGLAADIDRHLRDQPVLAGPPSAKYRLAKFVKRNRAQVVGAGVVAGVLVLGVVGTTTGMVWAMSEKERADTEAARATESATAEADARHAAEANEGRARESAARAERELARAVEIKRLITQMLQSVKPEEARGADTTLLKGILDDAAKRLSAGEISDELISAELHQVVGDVYWRLGLYPEAETHLPVAAEIRRRILGEEHQDTLVSTNRLAMLRSDQGRYAEAEPLLVKTLESRRRVLGPEHPSTLETMNSLAVLYARLGQAAKSEALFVDTLRIRRRVLGEEHRDTLLSMNNLVVLYTDLGRFAEAETLCVRAMEIYRRVLGEQHPDTIRAMGNLAPLYERQHRYAEAEPIYLKTLEIQKRVLGEEHPDTLATITNLGLLYNTMGRREDAAGMFEKSVPIKRRVLGLQHPRTRIAMQGLAQAYEALGRRPEALALRREVLGVLTTAADAPGADANTLNNAAWELLEAEAPELRDPKQAVGYAQRACKAEQDGGGANLWMYLDTLAVAQHAVGDAAAAVQAQKQAVSLVPEASADRADMEKRLAEYEAALAAAKGATAPKR
jgi:serine/threonine protein kinase/tetratricopeptide (TPR) repeat protein